MVLSIARKLLRPRQIILLGLLALPVAGFGIWSLLSSDSVGRDDLSESVVRLQAVDAAIREFESVGYFVDFNFGMSDSEALQQDWIEVVQRNQELLSSKGLQHPDVLDATTSYTEAIGVYELSTEQYIGSYEILVPTLQVCGEVLDIVPTLTELESDDFDSLAASCLEGLEIESLDADGFEKLRVGFVELIGALDTFASSVEELDPLDEEGLRMAQDILTDSYNRFSSAIAEVDAAVGAIPSPEAELENLLQALNQALAG